MSVDVPVRSYLSGDPKGADAQSTEAGSFIGEATSSSGASVHSSEDEPQKHTAGVGVAAEERAPVPPTTFGPAARALTVGGGANGHQSGSVVPNGSLTLMIRNIPIWYSQEMLLQEWPHTGSYDFLYVPYSIRSRQHNGFAFINFTSQAAATNFYNRWHKSCLVGQPSNARKPLNITVAAIQGLIANLDYLDKRRVARIRNKAFQPVIFLHGNQISFDCAVKQASSQLGPTRALSVPLAQNAGATVVTELTEQADYVLNFSDFNAGRPYAVISL